VSAVERYERAVARRQTATELRRAGMRPDEIAVAMGVSRQRVHQLLSTTPVRPGSFRSPDAWVSDLRVDLDAALRMIESGMFDGAASVLRADLALLEQRFGIDQ
jgi:hypothetical protein